MHDVCMQAGCKQTWQFAVECGMNLIEKLIRWQIVELVFCAVTVGPTALAAPETCSQLTKKDSVREQINLLFGAIFIELFSFHSILLLPIILILLSFAGSIFFGTIKLKCHKIWINIQSLINNQWGIYVTHLRVSTHVYFSQSRNKIK